MADDCLARRRNDRRLPDSEQSVRRSIRSRFSRMDFRICYCATIPGKCWLSDSASTQHPKPVTACLEIHNDLLHAPAMAELLNRNL